MNNLVLVLTGAIFCLNIIVSVFMQVDFTAILEKSTSSLPDFSILGTTANIFD